MNRVLAEAVVCIRGKLQRGEVSLGSWIQLPSPDVAEIVAWGGFDWVAVDAEHGAISHDALPAMARAIASGGAVPLVRLATPDPSACARALDAGMCGVIAPRIESADQLGAIRAASLWPPAGNRGVGFARANQYGDDFDRAILQQIPPLVVGMIESAAGVMNISEITTVKGLDAIFIGPYDLSASLGVPGELDHADVADAKRTVCAAAVAAGVPVGLHSVSPDVETLNRAIEDGFTFVAYSTDAQFLLASAKSPFVRST